MSKILYDDKHYELEPLRERMDPELVARIDPGLDEQHFFDRYLQEHLQKYGKRFTVS